MEKGTDTAQRALEKQVAVVTGSTQGIGAGIATTFAAQGACVVIHGLPDAPAEKTLNAIGKAGGKALLIRGDLKEEAHCRNLIRKTIDHFGRLDILVNNAGVYHRSNIENTTVQLWDHIFAINLRAPFILCQEAVKHMKERENGCIINIGSVNAYMGERKLLPYSASKGGLMTFTKNLANYLTRYRIRVNQINPGWVLTEGEHHMEAVEEGRGENWLEDALKTRPFGRMLLPEDIARAALFLASSELITGAILDYEQVPVGSTPDL